MKILIDINHPAHVHYFKNFIHIMEQQGHSFKVINRDSQMINALLDAYQIEHIIRNKRPKKKGTVYSILNLIQMVWHCIKESAHFHPDIYLGFASSACAITSFIFRKPCVLMDDTEHNAMNHKLYLPFCSMVLTPYYFQKTLGKKQQYFKAYVEQLYLYSEYFMPHGEVLERLDLKPREYVLVRYIAYDAHHDFVAHPLSEEKKKKIVKELSKKYKVLVSLEKDADDPFYEPYKIKIRPEEMHDIEAQAKFMITEGATMASEAFVMGVPYLYMNPLKVGNVNEQVQRCPSFAFQSVNENEINKIIKKMEMLSMDNAKQKVYIESRTVNPTQYLIETINRFVNRHD